MCLNGVFCCHVVSEKAWHCSQAVGKPVWGTGDVAFWKSVMWQAEQGLVGTVVKLLFTWQLVHDAVRWAPASGKTFEWFVNVPCCHVASVYLWHVSHVVRNPEAAWGGFFEFWKSCM